MAICNFSARGRGEGESLRRQGGGVFGFKIETPRRGGISRRGGGGRRAGRVSAGNWGGGRYIFCLGAEIPTKDMNGGSSGLYLARTPCVPFFILCFTGVETEGLVDCQGGSFSIVRWNLRPVMLPLMQIFGRNVLEDNKDKTEEWSGV